jgi:hypothetical protein
MDAAVTYIDQALNTFEQEFGPDLLHEKFNNYLPMKQALREVGLIMAQSRGSRDQRDRLYQGIRDDLVPTLIDQHYELETSSGVLKAAYESRIQSEKRETTRFWLTWVVGFLALLAAVAALYPIVKPVIQQSSSSAAVTRSLSAETSVSPSK